MMIGCDDWHALVILSLINLNLVLQGLILTIPNVFKSNIIEQTCTILSHQICWSCSLPAYIHTWQVEITVGLHFPKT